MSEPKPKTYQLTKEQLAELSYLATERTSSMEVANFWDKRMDKFMAGVRGALAIEPEYDVKWDDAFTKGIITAIKNETRIPTKEEVNAKP